MEKRYRELIANEFRDCVMGTIGRITQNDQTYRPFHIALLSGETVFWSAFERSFSTSFGQRVIEEIARLAALSNGADIDGTAGARKFENSCDIFDVLGIFAFFFLSVSQKFIFISGFFITCLTSGE